MGGPDGKIFDSKSIHFKLASQLIAFIADDIRYCANFVFTAGAGVVPNRVRQVNRSMFADQFFKE